MRIFYRISDGSYKKERFENATKENCLRNFITNFDINDGELVVYADNVKDETWEWVRKMLREHGKLFAIQRTYEGSSAGSFRRVFNEALNQTYYDQVYFIEDDYAHLPGSRQILEEGLERAEYVTLYNHPDKYIPASQGGNPLIGNDGAEATKVFVTKNSYWMLTNSTTMTFAAHMSALREDKEVWEKYTQGTHPHDMQIFLELRGRGRTLIQPIPTMATHCEAAWASHLIGTGIRDWNQFLKDGR